MYNELQFKEYDFRLRIKNERREIYDVIRRKWVKITPEEWVRQNIIRWLNDEKGIPFTRISSETGLIVNKLNKRADIIVYDKELNPEIIIECKAPNIKLDEKVLMQAINYNSTLTAKQIMITNGRHYLLIDLHVANATL